MTARLSDPLAKVERAKVHIRALEAELQTFFGTNPYVIGTKRNPETRRLVYYIVSVSPTPVSISAIAGETLQSLRSALDHLAYQLVIVGTGHAGPFRHVYFPIADSEANYEAKKNEQLKGASKAAIDAIDALRPYKGGNDTLWLLDSLNNIDKHRLLITVGSALRSVDLGALVSQGLQSSIASSPSWQGITFPTMHAFYTDGDRMCPLKPGDELFIDATDAKPNEEMQFRFDVAFNEPGITDSDPVFGTLQKVVTEVEGLITSFEPLL